MGIMLEIQKIAEKNPNGDPMDLAVKMVRGMNKESLIFLISEEIKHAQRCLTRFVERDAFVHEIRKKFSSIASIDFESSKKFAELFKREFRIGDGRVVTYGAATLADHRQRVQMLTAQVLGIQKTIEFHEWAIEQITSAGVKCLNEISRLEAA